MPRPASSHPAAALAAGLALTLLVVAAPVLAVALAPPVVAASVRTFYVDPLKGADANAGTSTAKPWRTLARATSAVLQPGDTLRLLAGRTHVGSLTLAESGTASAPVLVTSYGAGTLPVVTGGSCVTVTGARVVVRGIEVRACAYGGITLRGAFGVVDRVLARGSVAGVYVAPSATDSLVTGSTLLDNRTMVVRPGADDDYGAHGVLVEGDRTTIVASTISGHHASSPDYGVDGSAIEVFGAVGTHIHHVRARDNTAFLELGGYAGNLASDTVLAWSEVTGSLPGQHFLVTRGAGQVFGPVARTLVEHTTVRLTGADAIGIGCYGGCGTDVLAVRNSIVDVAGGWSNADGPYVSEANVYSGWWGGPLGPGDLLATPGYVDAPGGDLRLTAASPAVDSAAAAGTPWRTDLAGGAPADGDGDGACAPDRGAWERAGTPTC